MVNSNSTTERKDRSCFGLSSELLERTFFNVELSSTEFRCPCTSGVWIEFRPQIKDI